MYRLSASGWFCTSTTPQRGCPSLRGRPRRGGFFAGFCSGTFSLFDDARKSTCFRRTLAAFEHAPLQVFLAVEGRAEHREPVLRLFRASRAGRNRAKDAPLPRRYKAPWRVRRLSLDPASFHGALTSKWWFTARTERQNFLDDLRQLHLRNPFHHVSRARVPRFHDFFFSAPSAAAFQEFASKFVITSLHAVHRCRGRSRGRCCSCAQTLRG